ncbi:WD repeat-containing protein wrap73, partial [Coemansia sp. BCRC 34301]
LLALGGYDQKIRVLNNLTWRPIATLVHRTQDIRAPVDMFTEVEIPHSLAQESEKVLSENGVRKRTRFDLEPMPASIRVTVPADVHRAVGERKAGVSVLEFSVEGELLVSVCDGMPNAVWVWEVAGMRLISVVQTLRPVRSCLWSPLEKTLAIATGGPTVCLWKMGDGCVMYESPSSATATASALQWNPNGESLAIMSKGLFMLGFGG